jgi:hypothetical protein
MVTSTATPTVAEICRSEFTSAEPVAARSAGSDCTPAATRVPSVRPTPTPVSTMLGSRSRR